MSDINIQIQRAASYEDVDLDKERDRPSRYKGRYSLQQKPVKEKKHKTRQSNSKNILSPSEFEEEYFTAKSDLKPNTSKIGINIIPDPPVFSSSVVFSPELDGLKKKLEKFTKETEKDKDNLVIPKDGGVEGVKIDEKIFKFGDALWLNLLAFLNNRSMTQNHIHRSVAAQYNQILRLREEKNRILDEIKNFRFDLRPEPEDLHWLHAPYHPIVLSNIRNASQAVNSLLRRYEEFLELHPTYQSMVQNEPKFTSEISTKINLLYVWENSMNELFNRVLEVKDYFDVITDAKRKRKSSLSGTSPTSPRSPVFGRPVWPTMFKNLGPTEADSRNPGSIGMDLRSSGSTETDVVKDFNSEEFATSISNMYTNVVGRSLRLRGMTVVLKRIRSICGRTLEKVAFPLQIPKQYAQAASIPVPQMFRECSQSEKKDLNELNVHHKFFKEMNLPTFYHQFSFLLRVPVDLVHQWLKMRSEKVVCRHWDLLTLNTLMEDSDDCLSAAIGVKIKYMEFVTRTTQNPMEQQRYLESFDMKLDVVFQNYLGYIRHWARTATEDQDVDVEWCEQVVNVLKSEWYRAKVHSTSVSRGEATAAQLFCNVAKDLINQIIRSYLTEKLDSAGRSLIEEDFDDEPQTMDSEEEESHSKTLLNSTCGNHSNQNDYVILLPTSIFERNHLFYFQSSASTMSLSLKTMMTLEHYVTSSDDIYLIAENRKHLEICRKKFEKSTRKFIESEDMKLSDDFCSCNDQISNEIFDVKEVALEASDDIWNCAQDLEKLILNGKSLGELSEKEISTMKATQRQAFNVAFEFDRELSKLISMPKHPEFAERSVKNFCSWADFVMKISESDRITSRWAAIPLNCLQILISHKVTENLDPETLEVLTVTMSKCLDHIYSPRIRPSLSANSFRKTPDEAEDYSQYDFSGNSSLRRVTVHERIKQTVDYVEKCRQAYLEENRKVGRIIELGEIPFEVHFLRSKKAPFEWQRLENKILGVGSFGTCYLVMNLRDNCLMAMKQVKVVRENNDNMRALVDEVDIFRQLDHPNLVQYFGIEVHKDEVLIFMEYCSGGTLAKVCKEGLDLDCVRRYTNFLLKAVDYLHKKQIVHRDIKPANIFLTQQDILKLGDFGCSFRIQGPATRWGEIITHVGTVSYQAPELQTNTLAGSEIPTSEAIKSVAGYGRAVDIWSTGCVVLEMITGKPPYHQLNHELQIIYQLGTGIPPKFTPEIENNEMTLGFLKKCLTVDSTLRPTAAELLQDTFANIDTDAYDCTN